MNNSFTVSSLQQQQCKPQSRSSYKLFDWSGKILQ